MVWWHLSVEHFLDTFIRLGFFILGKIVTIHEMQHLLQRTICLKGNMNLINKYLSHMLDDLAPEMMLIFIRDVESDADFQYLLLLRFLVFFVFITSLWITWIISNKNPI